MKRKITALLVMICMIVTMIPTAAAEESKPILSEMSDADLLAFLDENGVAIPEVNYATAEEMFAFARTTVEKLEDNPAMCFSYSGTGHQFLANQLKTIVNEYYGVDTALLPTPFASEGLVYSTVLGSSWQSNYANYNCYTYALGLSDAPRNPGNFCNGSASSVYGLAELIKGDLQDAEYAELAGYTYNCVKISSTRPTGIHAIAVRRSSNTAGEYHVMRLNSTYGTLWRHKPGLRKVMQYDIQPTTSVDWTDEGYEGSRPTGGDTIYSGSIYYVSFKTSHTKGATTATGSHYHSGSYHYYEYDCTCTYCYDDYTIWEKVSCSGNCSSVNSETSEGGEK